MKLTREEIRILISILRIYIPIAAPVMEPEDDDIMEALLVRLEKEKDNDTN